MTPEEIRAEWDAFIEYPDDSEKRYVTTASALIFAGVIAEMAAQREREACKQACEALRGTVSMFATSKECRTHNNAITCCVKAIRARGDT